MSKLKIGVIAVGYDCPRLNESLSAWVALKCGIRGTKLEYIIPPNPDYDFKIVCTTALFKEYAELGAKYDNDRTERTLLAYEESGGIDKAIIVKEPISDFESRNYCWKALQEMDLDLDLIFQIDLYDEFYTSSEIVNCLEFVKKNPLVDWFGVNFKNYVRDERHWIDGFCPPRIHWVKKHGGIDRFFHDNDLIYKNLLDGRPKSSLECSRLEIPRAIAHVRHLSWCGPKEYLKKKIDYQMKALGTCSYVWDDLNNRLAFRREYYLQRGINPPEINED